MVLKEYLRRVCELERVCYEQSLIFHRIKRQIEDVEAIQLRKEDDSRESENILGYFLMCLGVTIVATPVVLIGGYIVLLILYLCCVVIWFVAKILGISIVASFLEWCDHQYEFVAWALLVLGVLACIVVLVILPIKLYRDAKRENAQTAASNAAIRKANQITKLTKQTRIDNLTKELERARAAYCETKRVLDRYYAADIIYPKYRAIVPVTMFYEYICSGRCTKLEGHEGAYNIYEQELRMNRILGKLDEVIARLDDIRDNQYMLANAMQECRRTATRIGAAVERCSDQLNAIEQNTEATKYYANVSALSSGYEAWLLAGI